MTWASCMHPCRPDNARCDGCPLRCESPEARDAALLRALTCDVRAAAVEEVEAFRQGRG